MVYNDNNNDNLAQKRMSSSMHEVFHWGPNTSGPKKLSLSVAGSQIDFEGPPASSKQSAAARYSARNRHSMVMVDNSQGEEQDVLVQVVDVLLAKKLLFLPSSYIVCYCLIVYSFMLCLCF